MNPDRLAFVSLISSHSPIAGGRETVEITEWGTDRDVYRAGDRPRAFIEIKNAGTRAIRDATVRLTVSKKMPIGSITLIRDQAHNASEFVPGFNVPPGESRRFEVAPFQIPDTSLAKGTYELRVDIVIMDILIGTLRKNISVK